MAVLCRICALRRFDKEELPPVRTARTEPCGSCGGKDPGGNYTMPDFQIMGTPDFDNVQDPERQGGGGGSRAGYQKATK